MVLLGLRRFAPLRSVPLRFAAFAPVSLGFEWFRVASPFSSCPRLVPLRFVSSAPRVGSIAAGVAASPAIGGLESYGVGWWEIPEFSIFRISSQKCFELDFNQPEGCRS